MAAKGCVAAEWIPGETIGCLIWSDATDPARFDVEALVMAPGMGASPTHRVASVRSHCPPFCFQFAAHSMGFWTATGRATLASTPFQPPAGHLDSPQHGIPPSAAFRRAPPSISSPLAAPPYSRLCRGTHRRMSGHRAFPATSVPVRSERAGRARQPAERQAGCPSQRSAPRRAARTGRRWALSGKQSHLSL